MRDYCVIESMIGKIGIKERCNKISGIFCAENMEICNAETDLQKKAAKQLYEYFEGKRKVFDLPLYMEGTEFQKKVWKALTEIPYGETRSYGDIAKAVGNKNACRAVGGANHKNPLLIVVPCHRVIGKDGSMTGFGCGIDVKVKLLELEKNFAEN